jgi:hypothetical protein
MEFAMKSWHMIVCGLLIGAGIVLVATGASAVALIPAAGCALMIGLMAWMMAGAARNGDGKD